MPPAYKWRPLPAGAFGRSVNPETIRRNQYRASLTPLEAAFERARANRGNLLKQRRDFARRYHDYIVLADADKAAVDQGMVTEANEALDRVRLEILADWRRYYPNQFDEDGEPLVDPPIPVQVNTPPNSPSPTVNPLPKLRPAERLKRLIDSVLKQSRSQESSRRSSLMPSRKEDRTSESSLARKDAEGDLDMSFCENELEARGGPMLDCAKPAEWVLPNSELYEEWEEEGREEDGDIIDLSESGDETSNSLEDSDEVDGEGDVHMAEEDESGNRSGDAVEGSDGGEEDEGESEEDEDEREDEDEPEEEGTEGQYSEILINSEGRDINTRRTQQSKSQGLGREGGGLNKPDFARSSGRLYQDAAQKHLRASNPEVTTQRDFCGSSKEQEDRVKSITTRKKENLASNAQIMVLLEAAARKDAEHLGIDLEEMDRIDREMDRLALLKAAQE